MRYHFSICNEGPTTTILNKETLIYQDLHSVLKAPSTNTKHIAEFKLCRNFAVWLPFPHIYFLTNEVSNLDMQRRTGVLLKRQGAPSFLLQRLQSRESSLSSAGFKIRRKLTSCSGRHRTQCLQIVPASAFGLTRFKGLINRGDRVVKFIK